MSRSLQYSFEAALRNHRGLSDYDRDDDHGPRDRDDDDTIGPKDRDGDRDAADSSGYVDRDEDSEVPGSPAGPVDARAIEKLVERYFEAALAGDGIVLCALQTPEVAHQIAFDYGSLPSYARGSGCASMMSKLFGYNHAQLALEASSLEGIHARLTKDHGWVLLAFRGISTRQLTIQLQHGTWKLASAIDQMVR